MHGALRVRVVSYRVLLFREDRVNPFSRYSIRGGCLRERWFREDSLPPLTPLEDVIGGIADFDLREPLHSKARARG